MTETLKCVAIVRMLIIAHVNAKSIIGNITIERIVINASHLIFDVIVQTCNVSIEYITACAFVSHENPLENGTKVMP